MALRMNDSGIRRKMLMNSFFFAKSIVNHHLDAMANNIPRICDAGTIMSIGHHNAAIWLDF
jgi:hypothetical protein